MEIFDKRLYKETYLFGGYQFSHFIIQGAKLGLPSGAQDKRQQQSTKKQLHKYKPKTQIQKVLFTVDIAYIEIWYLLRRK